MTLKFTGLISRVRVLLNRNHVEVSLLPSDEHTLLFDDVVRQKLMVSAKYLLESAPLELIDTHKPLVPAGVATNTEGVLEVGTPADYLRLHHVKVDTWDIPVVFAVPDGSEEAMTTKSAFAGIRPNGRRPMVVQHMDTISLHGSPGRVQYAAYIALPKVEDNRIELPAKLLDAILHYAAGLVCDTYGDEAHGVVFKRQAVDLAGMRPAEEEKKK